MRYRSGGKVIGQQQGLLLGGNMGKSIFTCVPSIRPDYALNVDGGVLSVFAVFFASIELLPQIHPTTANDR